MSKKISLIIAIVVALLGVVVTSIFGQVPVYLRPKILLEEISFESEDIIINNVGNKIYNIKIDEDNMSVDVFSMVTYKPLNATDKTVAFALDCGKDIAVISPTGFLTFKSKAIKEFDTITVTITSQDTSMLTDKLLIKNANKKYSDSNSFEDFEW